jgi:hypothetical protein
MPNSDIRRLLAVSREDHRAFLVYMRVPSSTTSSGATAQAGGGGQERGAGRGEIEEAEARGLKVMTFVRMPLELRLHLHGVVDIDLATLSGLVVVSRSHL